MPNVGAGLPQATFVISDNINNHSSGYQALPIESVEAKIQRITPAQFLPLIKLLLLARSNRNMRPGRSMIAEALRQYGDVYKRAGVNTFKDYSMLAQQASLIELGGREGDAWIALHPNLFKDKTNAQKSPTPSTVLNNSFFASQGNVRTSTATTPPSSSASQSTIPESVEDKIRRITPAQFLPLINQLLLARSKGNTKPGRSTIADALSQCDKDVYKRAGVNKFKDYSMLAQQASLIKLGGWEGDAWIALHPNLFKDKTIASKSPTPSTVLNNSSSAPQGNVRTSTATIPPSSSASQSTISNTNTSHLPNNEPIPRHFYPLMDYLARVGRAGLTKPLRSSVGLALGPGVYATAGASSLKEYLALAVRVGAVECGGSDSYAWVRLHPDVRADGRRPI
ncbi:hypothetical protein M405DRAFT_820514 [Rhizopogon salebrosus TDB-379]|nr:hypothetical protein M405DRAFT_820514 [Rhizopogon salebrosus TDB-379]